MILFKTRVWKGIRCSGRITATLLALVAAAQPRPAPAQVLDTVLFEDFSRGALTWQAQRLDRRETDYQVVPQAPDSALEGRSENAAAGLWRALDAPVAEQGMVSWRWWTEMSLAGNEREREKQGDDYAARVFLTFGGDPFTRGTRALAYAWAGREAVGSVYPNPYVAEVITIVLRSGDGDAGRWVSEERDFVADYLTAFGEEPPSLTAVALLVDTDDTSSRAVARFDDILVRVAGSHSGD